MLDTTKSENEIEENKKEEPKEKEKIKLFRTLHDPKSAANNEDSIKD